MKDRYSLNKPTAHQMQYIEYIRNTGLKPLPITAFDEDWEPIGNLIRSDLAAAGLIYYGGKKRQLLCPEGIYLRPDLEDGQ